MQLLPLLFLNFIFILLNIDIVTSEVRKVAISNIIIVDKNGYGNFTTIQAAIDSISPGNNNWIKVQIHPGIYTEKVTIPLDKPYIYLEGQGAQQTIITFDDHDSTDTSATFTSYPENVVAKGISFKNGYNLDVRDYYSLNNIIIEGNNNIVKQAVAARIYGDKSAFFGCGFLGFQDTLWDAIGRHYFKNCYIEGAMDFIFGYAQSYYENTWINVTVGEAFGVGYVTAQGRQSESDPSGFVFRKGWIWGSGQVMLGRAYGPYSRVIFHGTDLGAVVAPQGWDAWTYRGQEDKFTYAEVDCKGVGSDTSKRVAWEKKLTYSQMHDFSRSAFIDRDGWISRLP